MFLILDTSILIALERDDKNTIKKLSELSKIYPGIANIAFIPYYEFLLGIKNRYPKNQAKAVEFLNTFFCLTATKQTATILTDLRYNYQKKGISFSLADLFIAAQVIEHNAMLITKDKVFEKIEEMNKIILD